MSFDKNRWSKETYDKYLVCIRKDEKEVNAFIKDLCKHKQFTEYVRNKIMEDLTNTK